KPGEQIPMSTLIKLNGVAKKGEGLQILLFDSGHKKLYGATCTGIEWDKSGQRIPTPQKDATPTYYNESPYYAWFRFTKIDDVVDLDKYLNTLSYLHVPEFFVERQRGYERFNGKVVHDAEELVQQNRTI